MSLTARPVGHEEHQNWLADVIQDSRRKLFVALAADQPVGAVRLDETVSAQFEVSITVRPESRGKGLGRAILRYASTLAFNDLKAHALIALIKEENLASRRIFEDVGYRCVATEEGVRRYTLDRMWICHGNGQQC